MTLRKTIWFITIVALATACGKLKEEPLVVDFVMKDFKKQTAGGCNGDSICVSFEVQYPEFVGLDTAVRASITERVNYILNGSQEEPKSLEEMGNDFIKDFESFIKEMPGYDLGWYFRGQVKVLISSDTLISLQVDTESFTGGVHPSYTTNFVNVEPKTGTAFLLDAMLRPGYKDELNRLGEEDLRGQLELADTDSLAMPELADGKFQLNDNYGFRKEGIVFYFNDYEVGSFAEGPIEILIPYETIQEWKK
jgi:hypothetical protein